MMHYAYMIRNFLDQLPGLFSAVPAMTVAIVTYVLTAWGLFTMADRRGIQHAWLAWIPVLNVWVLGSLSDQYRYVVKRQVKSKRKILLTLRILSSIIGAGFAGFLASVIVSGVFGFLGGASYSSLVQSSVLSAFWILGLGVLLLGIKIAYTVLYYVALYDVFVSCDPENAVLFLVFSILVRVTCPFFLFFNRTKEQGMPPRMERPSYRPVYENRYDSFE